MGWVGLVGFQYDVRHSYLHDLQFVQHNLSRQQESAWTRKLKQQCRLHGTVQQSRRPAAHRFRYYDNNSTYAGTIQNAAHIHTSRASTYIDLPTVIAVISCTPGRAVALVALPVFRAGAGCPSKRRPPSGSCTAPTCHHPSPPRECNPTDLPRTTSTC